VVRNSTTSLPPFSIIHRTQQKFFPCGPFLRPSIRNAWTTARSIWTYFPSRYFVFNISIKAGFFQIFLLAFKTNHTRKLSGVFTSPYIPKILMELLLRIFVEDVRCLHGFFYPFSCQWAVDAGCESAPVNQLMRRIPKSATIPLTLWLRHFNIFSVPEGGSQMWRRSPFICSFLASSPLSNAISVHLDFIKYALQSRHHQRTST